MGKRRFNVILLVLVLLANVGCDQVSKTVVRKQIAPDQIIEVVPRYFELTKVENTGAFLSLGNRIPSVPKFILLSLLPLMAIGFAMLYMVTKFKGNRLTLLGFACVAGGGIGNLYDRMVYGSVTDFMHMDFVLFETGIFNMADVSIMAGVLLLFLGGTQKMNRGETVTQHR